VISTLKAAFVQGRLTKDEFDTRVGQTFGSRTYAELAVITADIPAGLAVPADARPVRTAAREPMSNSAKAGVCVSIAVVTLVLLTALFGPAGFVLCLVFYFLASLAGGAQMLDNRYQKRAREQRRLTQPTELSRVIARGRSAQRLGTRGRARSGRVRT
jgi:hypothetical protein